MGTRVPQLSFRGHRRDQVARVADKASVSALRRAGIRLRKVVERDRQTPGGVSARTVMLIGNVLQGFMACFSAATSSASLGDGRGVEWRAATRLFPAASMTGRF